MEKNFKKLEVGRRYRNRGGDVVRIVSLGVAGPYPFKGHDNRKYTATGVCYEISNRLGLIELLPEEPTRSLAELEAKREELDKEIEALYEDIEALKKNTQTVYCEAFMQYCSNWIGLEPSATQIERKKKIKESAHPTIATFELPFRKVNGHWEPAFEIVLK